MVFFLCSGAGKQRSERRSTMAGKVECGCRKGLVRGPGFDFGKVQSAAPPRYFLCSAAPPRFPLCSFAPPHSKIARMVLHVLVTLLIQSVFGI
ncbi:hypothetical protein V6N13_015906 [Hibiscus sabdariffa]|uniref:Uncharacterized protein n=1 Tax=Hibiscus sabdariffa TaxID=183260 RepID=A0ABR2CYR4_9ROSI